MKPSEVRNMSDEELIKKEKELREELSNLSFQHKIRPLEDTSRMNKMRKDIARINTINRERAVS
ncbi:50S ribosomal protein L29 [Desulfopila inferna]|uniref:50S ribosomal protein L29 n=1 Tax=Desulfopila inferna TaxID=468528 RepID=UPI0019648AEF|nr:50S ribosomal protein L29 [Desulfopila inferna]MBM9605427.1 50S ribosomal protein L29 [Desulfopila inferna]